MRVAYFVHNLNDPAVAKRVSMLRRALIDVVLIGFWRDLPPAGEIAGARTIPLAETFDAALLHRAASSLRYALFLEKIVPAVSACDVLIARNLEMLAIAASTNRRLANTRAMVYEVLDIHRSLLGRGIVGRTLRSVERALMSRIDLLITSSLAFVREYFNGFQSRLKLPPVAVVENKSLELGHVQKETYGIEPGPPWRIAWLGMIRCRRSLQILRGLASRRPDLLEVKIYGRPTQEIADDLERLLPAVFNVEFGGRYRPEDLKSLYGSAHFNWAIDYYEEGANSRWLLPNRIYEGGRFAAVPLADSGTETGHWLEEKRIGALFADPESQLESFLDQLTPTRFAALKQASLNAPRSLFVAGQGDCDRLHRLLSEAKRRREELGSAGRWNSMQDAVQ